MIECFFPAAFKQRFFCTSPHVICRRQVARNDQRRRTCLLVKIGNTHAVDLTVFLKNVVNFLRFRSVRRARRRTNVVIVVVVIIVPLNHCNLFSRKALLFLSTSSSSAAETTATRGKDKARQSDTSRNCADNSDINSFRDFCSVDQDPAHVRPVLAFTSLTPIRRSSLLHMNAAQAE